MHSTHTYTQAKHVFKRILKNINKPHLAKVTKRQYTNEWRSNNFWQEITDKKGLVVHTCNLSPLGREEFPEIKASMSHKRSCFNKQTKSNKDTTKTHKKSKNIVMTPKQSRGITKNPNYRPALLVNTDEKNLNNSRFHTLMSKQNYIPQPNKNYMSE